MAGPRPSRRPAVAAADRPVTSPALAAPAVPAPGAIGVLRPLGLGQVRLGPDGLLGQWYRRNATATLPHCVDRLRTSGNLGNLRAAAGEAHQEFRGMWFADSDVYKTLEAAAWQLAGSAPGGEPGDGGEPIDEAGLRAFVADTAALLVRAQEPDGYLNSYFTLVEPDDRWRKPHWSHELYCAGHLIQAAVAAGRAGVGGPLLGTARRFADLLVARFGPDGADEVCGHPEIETALVELYRLTGHRPYLELAARFVGRRGRGLLTPGPFGPRYFQDHVPPREAREVAGHAVRQLYLLAGMVDVAVETGDHELLAAAERLWADAFHTRMHLTGAHGSRHRDESYGGPYELPPDRAYAETCAAIAAVHCTWRLLLATGEARYADEMERALYNAVAVAVSGDGTRFFYSNPLQVRTGQADEGEEASTRRLPWYSCACCPPNLARLFASLPGHLATGDDDGLRIHLYGSATVDATVRGVPIRVRMRTEYPWQGRVELTVTGQAPAGHVPWTLALRVPAWCAAHTVLIDGVPVQAEATGGYVRLSRAWAPVTTVVLDLDLPVRLVSAHPRVDAVRGCVALARGPLVYCVEQVDLTPDTVLEDVRLDPEAPVGLALAKVPGTAAPPVVLLARGSRVTPGDASPYRAAACDAGTAAPTTLRAVPYFLWGNRAKGAMRVWIPVRNAG